jgi:pimeloyl-ACP methyl ester carboxylesterase
MVQDLHALLVNTQMPPPYVLVGWSVAGLNVRLYAHQYPNEVAGVVFVDAVHPDQGTRLLAVLPPESATDSPSLKELRQGLTRDANGPTENPENMDVFTSRSQVRALGTLGALPVVVLTAGRSYIGASEIPPELQPRFQKAWEEMQDELARLSTNSTHIILESSQHCIPCDDPAAIADAIRTVVDQVRNK